MNILILKKFNNYFNRVVLKYDTLQKYKNKAGSYLAYSNINFNPNDGILTELVIGNEVQIASDKPLDWEDSGAPDYLICYETSGTGESGDPVVETIKSRWFILEAVRTRNGQYRVALKRDVLADNYESIMEAPCYVEKGIVNDINNPLIFNPENISTNQIKQNETPLIDESGSAWLVGYIKKNLGEKNASGTMVKDLENAYDFDDLYFKNAIDSDDSEMVATDKLIVPTGMNLKWMGFSDSWPFDDYYGYTGNFTTNNNVSWTNVGNQNSSSWELLNSALITFPGAQLIGITGAQVATRMNEYSNTIPVETRNSFRSYLTSSIKTTNGLKETTDYGVSEKYGQLIQKYNGAIVIKNNVAYKLNISIESSGSSSYGLFNYLSNSIIGTYFDYYISDLASYFGTSFSRNSPSGTGQKLRGNLSYNRIVISAVKQDTTGAAYHIKLPQSASRIVTDDALYDVFAVPYIPNQYSGEKTASFKDPLGNTIQINSEAMLFIVQKLMTQLNIGESSGAEAYDLQILPYCPIKMPQNNDLSKLDHKSYSLITQEQGEGDPITVGYVIFAPQANFTKDIAIEKSLHKPIKVSKETIYDDLTYTTRSFGHYTGWQVTSMLGFPQGMPDEPNIESYNLYINGEVVSTENYKIVIIHGALGGLPDMYQILLNPDTYDAGDYDTKIIFNYTDQAIYTPLELKVANETEFMRLTSPNFNGMFEFRKTKLNDGLHYVNIDCTYKPYSPYIKLNPDFSFMYGNDFNDSTGLICGGDFSISVLNDAWREYQLNNKNYQAIFNRQIQNLDFNNQIAQEQMNLQNTTGFIAGTLGGGVSGGLMGAKAGPWGAIAGAALGTIGGAALSGYGAKLNEDWLNRQQGETKTYTIDMYNYQLGNVKALPQSISKSDPLTYNNKIWPILEEFGCTEKEKELLLSKLAYNGMTIMAIGQLTDYCVSNEIDKVYVKGQLIRMENITDDFHVIDEIYKEVDKGFYIPQGE